LNSRVEAVSADAQMREERAALWVIGAGVVAALHVGKLPVVLPIWRQEMSLSLVQGGFLLAVLQGAGLTLGALAGVLADRMGLRRTQLIGLVLLALGCGLGTLGHVVPALLAARVLEGVGLLLTVLPAPGLIRRVVHDPAALSRALGLWGAYMPVGTALALSLAPMAYAAMGWRATWWVLSVLSLLWAVVIWRGVPADAHRRQARDGGLGLWPRLKDTLSAPGPWLVALCFSVYSGQWLAVIGFLPTILAQAGVDHAVVGWGTALVAAANGVGNVAAGRLLGRGWSVRRLLSVGFLTMASMSVLAFAGGLAPLPQLLAVTVFSAVGGLIPATLFSLAVRLAPGAHTVSTTVGWVQQLSAFGQFAGPPLVAWLVGRHGGDWSPTYWFTTACALAGLWLAGALQRRAST